MPPKVPVPKPGPCPGAKRGVKKIADTITKPASAPVAKPAAKRAVPREIAAAGYAAGYTGPTVAFTAADRGAIDRFKQLRRLERDAPWEQQVQARNEMERVRVTMSPLMRARALQEARIEDLVERFADGQPVEQVKTRMAQELGKIFSGKKIATRVSEQGLLAALRDGRFKTQFESGASGLAGAFVPDERAAVEERLFGIARNNFPAARRPYYGYVLTSGVNASPADDAMLNVYGPIQVCFPTRSGAGPPP